MKLLKSDAIALGVSFVIITLSSVLLYLDFSRKVEVSGAKQIGTISFKREVAQRKYLSQVVWEDVEQNVPVFNNDSVRTSVDSEAVIHLSDGTEINVDENSMIQLSSAGGGININFNHGSISANRKGVSTAELTSVNIRSNESTISINRSNIQLTQLQNKELDLTVSEGMANVKTADKETIVKVNQKAIISSDRKKTEIVKLNFDLKSPEMNRRFIAGRKGENINFNWDVQGKFRDFKVDISDGRDFRKILYSINTGNLKKYFKLLKEGGYYWRVSAFNLQTRKREYSPQLKFNVIYHKPVRLVYPNNKDSFETVSGKADVSFKWEEDPLAQKYIFELSKKPDFSKIEKRVITELKNISSPGLTSGEYFWRIKSLMKTAGEDMTRSSSIGRFYIATPARLAAPKIIRPLPKSRINLYDSRAKGIVFSWDGKPQYKNYILEISEDKKFSKLLASEKVKANYKLLIKKFNKGKYFWRVKTLLRGENVPDTNISSFEIVTNSRISIVGAGEKSFSIEKGKSKDVFLAWKSNVKQGRYKLDIAKDSGFADVTSYVLSGNNRKISLSEPGRYFWRVSLVDKNDDPLISSRTGILIVKDKAKVPEAKKTVLLVRSPVKDSHIYINMKYLGRNSVTKEVVPGQAVKIFIKATRFRDYYKTVTLSEGQRYVLKPVMIKKKLLGRVKWSNKFTSALSAKPIYYKNRIVVATEGGEIKVLSSSGGTYINRKLGKKFESEPVISGSTIYAVDVSGILYSMNMNTGKLYWRVKTGGPLLFGSKPIVHKGKIYIASGYGEVQCYDVKGKLLWSQDLDEGIYSSPLVFNNKLIIITDAEVVYALDLEDGDEDWNEDIDGRVVRTEPTVYGDKLYFGTDSGVFYAMKIENGDVLWKFKADSSIYSTPLIEKGRIFIGSTKGTLYSINIKTGKKIWEKLLSKSVKGGIISAFGHVIVSDSNTVYAMSPSRGIIRWSQTFDTPIKTSPVHVDDTVVLGLTNGEIVSVRNDLKQSVK